MPIPTYDQFIEPLLRYLAAQTEPVRTNQIYQDLAKSGSLTSEDMAELLPSRSQPVYKNRIGWAHDRLKRAGYSESPRRGYWMLTVDGREVAKATAKFTPEEIRKLAKVPLSSRLRDADNGAGPDHVDSVIVEVESQSPEERIDSGIQELTESVVQDLLDVIGRDSPEFFEQLVLDVLHAMGYGMTRQDLQRVGRSGDGGIDGIISLDRLGLEKVYVQAKRWKGQVGSPQIQGFMGALQIQGADKGVLITSGAISKPAWDAAKQARGSVVLVDGQRLASLMIEHGVGVSHQVLKIPKIDMDYFEGE
ncbi:restriction endonuclease [Myxococcota bacterium]|nr:restriction endonuclease [Myxococcota bacterium]